MSSRKNNIDRQIRLFHQTLDILRAEDGCPWDRSQSISDMVSYLIDEVYELQSAVLRDDLEGVEEEIGDTIYVLIYIHYLFLDKRDTPLARIISGAHKKIRERHPHVFSDSRAETVRESISEWEKVKKSGRDNESLMDSVPSHLPPLRRAISVSRKAINIGFDWPDQEGILKQIEEEIEEFRDASRRGNMEEITDETGDLLFTMVNLAIHNGIDPEGAVNSTVDKFIGRFRMMEEIAGQRGVMLEELDMEELEKLWAQSKKKSG